MKIKEKEIENIIELDLGSLSSASFSSNSTIVEEEIFETEIIEEIIEEIKEELILSIKINSSPNCKIIISSPSKKEEKTLDKNLSIEEKEKEKKNELEILLNELIFEKTPPIDKVVFDIENETIKILKEEEKEEKEEKEKEKEEKEEKLENISENFKNYIQRSKENIENNDFVKHYWKILVLEILMKIKVK